MISVAIRRPGRISPPLSATCTSAPTACRGSASRCPSARIAQRSVESYLTGANNPPRWMERVAEIDRRVKRERRLLAAERRALRGRFPQDAAGFAEAWRAFAEKRGRSREHRELNELIRAHNEWYPIERNLPVNPRTGEWATVAGRSFLRTPVGPEWVLREFPAEE